MPRDYDDDHSGEGDTERILRVARAKVSSPAIGLIAVGLISIAGVLWGAINYTQLEANRDLQKAEIDKNPGMDDKTKEAFKNFWDQYTEGAKIWMPVTSTVALGIGILTTLGGFRMRQLRSMGLAKISAILSMLPCVSGCCILGLPFGIWALMVLKDPDVKTGFLLTANPNLNPNDLPEG